MVEYKKTPVINTHSGLQVNPLDLKESDIRIIDIAHSLSMINRFNGHTIKPINVAQHSVYVARIVSKILEQEHNCDKYHCIQCGHNRLIELQALFHDAAEAYLGDVTKWLKHSDAMAPFREAEHRAEQVIMKYLNCPLDQHELVTYADKMMVVYEAKMGFEPPYIIEHPLYKELSSEELELIGPWDFWKQKESKTFFLDHLRMLTNATNREIGIV